MSNHKSNESNKDQDPVEMMQVAYDFRHNLDRFILIAMDKDGEYHFIQTAGDRDTVARDITRFIESGG